MTYHMGGTQITECSGCGEVVYCRVWIADYSDPETGYVDEYAECRECAE